MIVVFDTNILISALVFPGGRAQAALQRVLDGIDRLLISKVLLAELLTVLARKFSRDPEELSRVAVWLSELALWVHPTRHIKQLTDEADNRVLECAVAGKADLIVTGDKRMLELSAFEGVRITSLREYLSETSR